MRIHPGSSYPFDLYSRGIRCGRGLTIIETIAMICVGVVVLSVIVPALGETRRRGKDTVCIQNLHRIIQASHIYAGRDPNESIIPAAGIEDPSNRMFNQNVFSQLVVYAFGGKSGVGTFQGQVDIKTSVFGPLGTLSARNRPLNSILYRSSFPMLNSRSGSHGQKWRPDANLNLDVYNCPADSGYTGFHIDDAWRRTRLTSFDHYGTSYAANVMWVGIGSPNKLNSNSPYLRPISRIPNPGRTIAYMENNGRSAWFAPPDPCPFGVSDLFGVASGWHGKDWTFNAAFIDGGVETIRMRGYRPERIPNSELASGFLDCITVRGDGWQVDTLPSPLISTEHDNPSTGRRVP